MFLEWFVNSIFCASKKYKGFRNDVLVTKKSILYHLKNGNLYVGDRFQEPSDVILPKNIDEACEVFTQLGYNERSNHPIEPIEKGYSWGMIKLPSGWTIIDSEEN